MQKRLESNISKENKSVGVKKLSQSGESCTIRKVSKNRARDFFHMAELKFKDARDEYGYKRNALMRGAAGIVLLESLSNLVNAILTAKSGYKCWLVSCETLANLLEYAVHLRGIKKQVQRIRQLKKIERKILFCQPVKDDEIREMFRHVELMLHWATKLEGIADTRIKKEPK